MGQPTRAPNMTGEQVQSPDSGTLGGLLRIFSPGLMREEPILLVAPTDSEGALTGPPQSTLLFEPEAVETLLFCGPDSVEALDFGVLLRIEGRTVSAAGDYVRDEAGRAVGFSTKLPFLTDRQLSGAEPIPGLHSPDIRNRQGGELLFSEGPELCLRTLRIDYWHKDSFVCAPVAEGALNKSLAKLGAKEPFELFVYGDSIASGCNSSSFLGIAPFQRTWPELVADSLEERFGSEVRLTNLAVGGWSSADALKTESTAGWRNQRQVEVPGLASELGERPDYRPDLAIVGFGMNDGNSEVSPESFRDNLRAVCDVILNRNPDCEILLPGTMSPNPDWEFYRSQERYFPESIRPLLRADKRLAGVDLSPAHRELLRTKRFAELAANNCNHPNDFMARVYAEHVLSAFRKNRVDGLRPRFHFSPDSGWSGDPNGLVKSGGVWHMCYQALRCPGGDAGVRWAHAVSKDLLHWRELGVVLEPDGYGVPFSGSAVVDRNNASGLFSPETDPERRLLAFYTSHNLETGREFVALARSAGGRSWEKIDGGAPILEKRAERECGGDQNAQTDRMEAQNGEKDRPAGFRDPKVFAVGGEWLMIVGGGEAVLYASRDLRHWQFQSKIAAVRFPDCVRANLDVLRRYLPENDPDSAVLHTECPDLLRMGARDVLSCGGLCYVVGKLIRRSGVWHFEAEGDAVPFLRNTSFFSHTGEGYAAQSFFRRRPGRQTVVCWLMDGTAFGEDAGTARTKCRNGVMSVPLELTLRRLADRYVLAARPVGTSRRLRKKYAWGRNGWARLPSGAIELRWRPGERGTAEFSNAVGQFVRLTAERNRLFVESDLRAERAELPYSGKTVRAVSDGAVFELFAEGGESLFTAILLADAPFDRLEAEGSWRLDRWAEGKRRRCVRNAFVEAETACLKKEVREEKR